MGQIAYTHKTDSLYVTVYYLEYILVTEIHYNYILLVKFNMPEYIWYFSRYEWRRSMAINLKFSNREVEGEQCAPTGKTYSWVNLVVPKNWAAYFSAISGRKFDLTTVLRSCWPIEWRRRGFIASGPFFSLFLTFAHEKNHFPVVKSGFWGHISH